MKILLYLIIALISTLPLKAQGYIFTLPSPVTVPGTHFTISSVAFKIYDVHFQLQDSISPQSLVTVTGQYYQDTAAYKSKNALTSNQAILMGLPNPSYTVYNVPITSSSPNPGQIFTYINNLFTSLGWTLTGTFK